MIEELRESCQPSSELFLAKAIPIMFHHRCEFRKQNPITFKLSASSESKKKPQEEKKEESKVVELTEEEAQAEQDKEEEKEVRLFEGQPQEVVFGNDLREMNIDTRTLDEQIDELSESGKLEYTT